MSRIESVDVFRLIAVIAIIIIHTTPFKGDLVESEIYKYLDVIFNQLSRFAVPFFFVISGYFWGVKIRNGAPPISTSLSMARRIMTIFLAWCFVYLLPYNVASISEHGILDQIKFSYWNAIILIHNPVTLAMQGTKTHLWFLIALLCALSLCAIFLHIRKINTLIIISIFLYIFGVLAKAYANTPVGIETGLNTRNGPFFSTIFFVTGYLLSGRDISEKWLFYGSILFCIGSAIHFIEIYSLWALFNTSVIQDYVIGTYFMGVGVALAALSNHPILKIKSFSKIGKMTLGIYAVHYIFVDLFRPIDKASDSVSWELGYILVVLILSVMTSLLLSKSKATKRFVV